MQLQMFNAAASIAITGAAALYDYETHNIPNRLILYGLGANAAVYAVWLAFGLIGTGAALNMAASTLIVLACLMPLYMLRAVGAGDVKLFAVLGGLLGTKATLHIALMSLVIAAVCGVPLIIKRREYAMHKIHFSYAILAALIISILRTQIIM